MFYTFNQYQRRHFNTNHALKSKSRIKMEIIRLTFDCENNPRCGYTVNHSLTLTHHILYIPLSIAAKASNLSTSPAATILQLNFPSAPAGAAASSLGSGLSPLVATPLPSSQATPVIGATKSHNNQSLFKLAPNSTPNNKHDTLSK